METTPKTHEFQLPNKVKTLPKDLTDHAFNYAKIVKEPVLLKDMYVYKESEYLIKAESFSMPKAGRFAINVFEFVEDTTQKEPHSLATSFRTDNSSHMLDFSPKLPLGGVSHFQRV